MTNISENLRFPRAKSAQPDFRLMGMEEQREFMVEGSHTERLQLAYSPYAHVSCLHELGCSDPSEDVRIAVANNQSTSPTTLNRMASDKTSESVLLGVAQNRNTPEHACIGLAGRGRPLVVRLAVAENPNCPEAVAAEVFKELRSSW